MDFTPELSAFQGVIISADNVHQFTRLTSKGGNEEYIKYVLRSMLRFLKGENFVNENGVTDTMVSKVRKFAVYIVLNADLPVLEEIVELEGIDLVIWTIPTIPKHLMCEMLWNLHMEQFIYEIITYSYPQLALEVLGAFIDNFKYFNPTGCLQKLHKLTAACYLLICRLHCFELESNILSNNLTTGFEHIQKLLKYFITPPNSYKLNVLSKDELYRYQGRCLHTALSLMYECFNQYTQNINPNLCDDIYKLTYKEGCFKGDCCMYNICDSPNDLILECLNNSNTVILDVSKQLVMDVSVDVFCAWSEFEENGKSFQQTIGELCHKIRTKLLSVDSVCEHPIVSMLQQIERKPIEINDIINTLDNKTIIDNINMNNEDKTSWIRALIHKDMLYEHTDLLQVIHANAEVYNEEECSKLYHILTDSTNNPENSQIRKLLSIKVFQRCSLTNKHDILKEHFSDNCFCDMTEGTEFQEEMTVIFNKLVVSPDADLTDVLTLFLQNPKQVYTKIFSIACENIQQTHIMLEIMKLLQDYSNYYYTTETEACVIGVTKYIFENSVETECKQGNFIKFVCGLKSIDIIPGTKLLLLVVMANIHKALLNKDIVAINVQIRLLQEAYAIDELLTCRAPMLAMLAQVMDVVRWRITTFVAAAPATLQLTIQLQTALMETYNGVVPDKESKWLKTKLQNIEPMNMYYYRILWNPPGRSYFEVISHKNINSDTNPSELKYWLTQITCTSTQQEWCEVWDSLPVFDDTTLLKLFHEAVGMITMGVTRHRTEVTRACLLYCYRNLVYIIRYKFFKEPLTNNQVVAAVGYSASLLKLTHAADVEDIGTILMPLLAYLAEKKSSITLDLPKSLNNIFKDTSYLDLVSKVFTVSV